MSDLRTELFTKVLPKMQSLTKHTELNNLSFDDPEQPEMPVEPTVTPTKLSNNELIFNWIKEHPACYGTSVSNGFRGRIPASSVISQLNALSRRGLLHRVKCSSTGNYMYSTAQEAYPRDSNKTLRLRKASEALGTEEMGRRISLAWQAKAKEEKIPRNKEKKVAPVPVPTIQVTPVDLNTLSIVQARKLYDELKQIFGA